MDTNHNETNGSKNQEDIPTVDYDGAAIGPGARIGQFRVEQELGRGAMGVVYLAHDSKLDRKVAIKSLPAEVMANPKVRSRFSREARLLASVNHPNIATIHEVMEEAEGVGYLVLEYVPGQTLAERIASAGLTLQELLPIALQIAEATAAAHEHDVIHRDLKPGNIKITPEGKVKVLDFGLAKAVGGETANQHSTITEPGRVIGTPAYMSPEQARGMPTDKRCDIWSFGCVLYEMLAAQIPFRGETISDTLANILQTEPNWQALPENTPANIRSLLRRCLEKDPRRRLRDIGDAGIEISETLTDSGSTGALTTAAPEVPRPAGSQRMAMGIVLGILLGAMVATAIMWSRKQPTPMPLSSFPISLPQNQKLMPQIAVSPDGRRMVYVGAVGASRRLFLREIDEFMSRELPETEGATMPFFSSDGQSLGFTTGGKLKTLSMDGGRPKILCDAKAFGGGSWGQDGVIYFSPDWYTGLRKISVDDGVPEAVTTLNGDTGEFAHLWPEVLPGGEAVLFTIWKTDLSNASIAVLSLKTGQWHTLLDGGACARYASTGHLLYVQSGTLMAAPFDLKRLEVGEPKSPVVEGLTQSLTNGHAPFSFSQDGSLYYIQGGPWLARRRMVWVNRQGDELEPLSLPALAYATPHLSPDVNEPRLAFGKFERGACNIWVYDLPSGPATQLTFKGNNIHPRWTPDGKALTFTSFRAGPFDVYQIPANRSSAEELRLAGPPDHTATSWSPDGTVLLLNEQNPDTGEDISLLSTEEGSTPQPLLHKSWDESYAVFSPDGNWIAYQSNQEGSEEVYVMPYPGSVTTKISTRGGRYPRWSRDGKELFYRRGNAIMAVRVETDPKFKVIGSEVLFEEELLSYWSGCYEISHDGKRFLLVKEDENQFAENQLIVVLNWSEELKRLVPTGKE